MINTILGIETATQTSSVSICHENNIVSKYNIRVNTHAESLIPMIHEIIQDLGITMQDIQAIGVGVGPGSFTGVRLGVGLAQALAFGLNIPVWGISSLEALAYQVLDDLQLDTHLILPAIDARMQGIYWGAYQFDNHKVLRSIMPDQLSGIQDIAFMLPQDALCLGSAIDAYPDVFEKNQIIKNKFPQAADIVRLTQLAIQSDISSTKPTELLPHYIRNNVAHQK